MIKTNQWSNEWTGIMEILKASRDGLTFDLILYYSLHAVGDQLQCHRRTWATGMSDPRTLEAIDI